MYVETFNGAEIHTAKHGLVQFCSVCGKDILPQQWYLVRPARHYKCDPENKLQRPEYSEEPKLPRVIKVVPKPKPRPVQVIKKGQAKPVKIKPIYQGPCILPMSGMYVSYQHGRVLPQEIIDECPFDL